MAVKKVLLINPPGKVYIYPDGSPAHRKHCTPPLGLAYLASTLMASDYEVEVVDAVAEGYASEWFEKPFLYYGLDEAMIVERVKQSKPDLVGVSILFSNIAGEALTICDAIKRALPEVPLVLGGHHPTGAPREMMARGTVDFVVLGEAETSFLNLLEHLNGRLRREQVRALYYRKDGRVETTMNGVKSMAGGTGWNYYRKQEAGVPLALDELPFPAWDIFPMESYWRGDVRIGGGDVVRDRFAVMMSTRGCPHVCYFCTSPLMSGFKGYRMRSIENVVAEIRWLRERYGVEEIQFLDDNFYVSKPRVKKLLRVLAVEFPDMVFGVPGGTEVNALDDEVIDLMAEAHFYKTLLAIEAGDPRLQEALIDKKVDVHRVPQVVERLKSRGIETRALFMIGFPDEKRDQIEMTVRMARTLDVDDFYFSLVTPLPGTPLFDQCAERGLFVEGFDTNNIRFSLTSIRLPDTTSEELEGIRRSVWREQFEAKRNRMHRSVEDPRKKFTSTREYELVGFRKLDEVRAAMGIPA